MIIRVVECSELTLPVVQERRSLLFCNPTDASHSYSNASSIVPFLLGLALLLGSLGLLVYALDSFLNALL